MRVQIKGNWPILSVFVFFSFVAMFLVAIYFRFFNEIQ